MKQSTYIYIFPQAVSRSADIEDEEKKEMQLISDCVRQLSMFLFVIACVCMKILMHRMNI